MVKVEKQGTRVLFDLLKRKITVLLNWVRGTFRKKTEKIKYASLKIFSKRLHVYKVLEKYSEEFNIIY